MSLVSLTVELPQYSRTFSVEVPLEGSVREVKIAISLACPGKPRVDGQRLVHKGRILEDGELVQQLWKADEPRVVHLAVHPSCWSKGPPESQTVPANDQFGASEDAFRGYMDTLNQLDESLSSAIQSLERHTSRPLRPSRLSSAPYTYPNAPQYIVYLHFKALRTLSVEVQMPLRAQASRNQKDMAKHAVLRSGRNWPTIFEEEFPNTDGADSGVKYTLAIIEGKPYLQLSAPGAEPSPAQQHAIRVLSFTFPLLSLRVQSFTRTTVRTTTTIHQPQPAVQFRAPPIRTLLAPLILLGLRTLLLLYFFSPARKPLFSILLGAWVLYEAWGAVRGALGGLNDLPGDGNPQQQGGGIPDAGVQRAAAGNNVNEALPPGRADRVRARTVQNPQRSTGDRMLSRLAKINLASEEQALAATNNINAEEPSFLNKAWSFITLFVLSLHPAIWKRRRKALREREGRVRAETIKRRAPEEETQTVGGGSEVGGSEEVTLARQRLIETHERRRSWVKEYIQRVEQDEWVDE